MSRSAGGILGCALLFIVLAALGLGDMKGHFTRKVLFDAKEAAHHEAALNILAYQEEGADLNPQCYLFWIGNYLHFAFTLLDFITDVIYIQTVPTYHVMIAVLLSLTLTIQYIVIAVLSWKFAGKAKETRAERVRYAVKAFAAASTGNLHIFAMLEDHSFDHNRIKYLNGLVLGLLQNVP